MGRWRESEPKRGRQELTAHARGSRYSVRNRGGISDAVLRFTRRSLLGMIGAAATLPLLGRLVPGACRRREHRHHRLQRQPADASIRRSAPRRSTRPSSRSTSRSSIPISARTPDLAFKPGLLTKWGWNDDKTKVHMEVREGAVWHDGDAGHRRGRGVVARARAATEGPAIRSSSSGRRSATTRSTATRSPATCSTSSRRCSSGWRFLTGYVLPKNYYEKRRRRKASRRSRSAPGPTWSTSSSGTPSSASRPTPNTGAASRPSTPSSSSSCPMPTSRVAEVESGRSDVTLEIPYEEFDRLKANPDFAGYATPISDIAMIFINDVDADARQERPARRQSRHRQEGDRRPAARAATACRSRRWRRPSTPPSIRRSRCPTIRSWPRSFSPRAASRPRSRSSSPSRPRAASSRRTTR